MTRLEYRDTGYHSKKRRLVVRMCSPHPLVVSGGGRQEYSWIALVALPKQPTGAAQLENRNALT
jgi:hypothetical protein